MTISGTAFNNPTGCLTLFQNTPDPRFEYTDPTANFAGQADVARSSDDHFVDLMDATSRATLATPNALTAADAHGYNWGLINWYLPIKVRADVALNDGTVLHTHDGNTVGTAASSSGGPAGYVYQTLASPDFTSGPATPAVVMLPNGGTWFRFQKPLTITGADVAAGTTFAVDLAFNPDGLVKGFTDPSSGEALVDAAGRSIHVPMLDLSPIPHRDSETVVRETYRTSISGTSTQGSDDFDVRLELYSVKQDPAKTLYGVSITSLANTLTTRPFSTMPRISFVHLNADGSLDLQDQAQNPVVAGFQRQTAVGGAATASVPCGNPSAFWFAGCGDNGIGSSSSQTFTLTAITEL